ncbi:MAG TPA: ABC transporter ATP-binding protein [Actinomycetota bacterium]|jgi:oligopeptide/dipeptide ABC transporter ATP-binding protein|nr:ABC transporter ATP-binding protein [Actinomycetota bacterium]
MTDRLLEVRSLGVDYRTRGSVVHAIDGVDLQTAHGEIVGVVGESGCGKSTLAAAVMGLLPPNATIHEGEVRFEGRDLSAMEPEALRAMRGRRVARIPQDSGRSLNPTLSVGRQFLDVLRAHRDDVGTTDLRRAMQDAVAGVGLADPGRLLRRYPHHLSGGMRQRVTIAMALALRPSLLVADEPTSALDVTIEAQILDLLRRLRDEHGMAIVFISHNLGAISQLCDRVVVMYAGQVVETSTVEAITRDPVHPYTRALLGAVPDPGVFGRALTTIPGTPPMLLHRPTGCRFAPRCPIVEESCRTNEPELVEVGDSTGRCLALDPSSPYLGTREWT